MPFLPEDLLSADAACLPVVAEVETNGQGDKELHSNEVSLPFTMSRILGVIGSLSSHWSGRLIRAPDKDKDKDKNEDVNEF